MTKKSFLVKTVLMSMLTAVTFSFASCQDDILDPDMAPQTEKAMTRGDYTENFNINSIKVKYNNNPIEPITAQNWWKANGIFVYDLQNGVEVTDWDAANNSYKGFLYVNLPWVAEGASQSNMPEKIWREVAYEGTPWQLVMNHCGNMATNRGNYFAVYNPYTGVMRYFVYVPQNISTTASHHMWQVEMSQPLAEHSVFTYGNPSVNKTFDASAIKALGNQGTPTQVSSPWVGSSRCDQITPKCGWWSFDVDLSLYRGNTDCPLDQVDNRTGVMTPAMVTSLDLAADLQSVMDATIKGKINLEAVQATTSGGVFGFLNNGLGEINNIAELITKIKDGNTLEAITAGAKLAEKGCNLLGIDTGDTQKGFDGYSGKVELALTGNIATKGTISTSTNVDAMGNPTLKKGDFDLTAAPTFGQGVWNIKSNPCIFYSNACVNWRNFDSNRAEEDLTARNPLGKAFGAGSMSFTHRNFGTGDTKSPFGGNWTQNDKSEKPYTGTVCFFDPSSIEVQLNPNVFPKGTEFTVQAICGVRNGMTVGSTESYRKAIGLGESKFNVSNSTDYTNLAFGDVPFDFFHGQDVKDMQAAATFGVDQQGTSQWGVFGRGNGSYLIEPQMLRGEKSANCMPAYEITVTLTVKVPGLAKPLIFSRMYLPEYKKIDINEMNQKVSTVKRYKPTGYVDKVWNAQMDHLTKLAEWMQRTLQPVSGPAISRNCQINSLYKPIWDNENESYCNLFDGSKETIWSSSSELAQSEGNRNYFDIEFKSARPVSPKGYTIVTAGKNFDSKYRPMGWVLYGKKNQGDKYVRIAEENNPSLPNSAGASKEYRFNVKDASDMQYFRLSVDTGCGKTSLGQFYFNY